MIKKIIFLLFILAPVLLSAEITKVILIPFSHQDIGFTATQNEVAAKYVEVYDKLPNMFEKFPDFHFSAETFWQFDQWLKSDPSEDKIQWYADQVENGRFEFGAAFGSMHSGYMNDLTLKETFRYIRNFAENYDIPLKTAFMNDVPGFTHDLPDYLSEAGIPYFMAGVNQGLAECNDLTSEELLFYWEGPDGGRVLTWVAQESYMEGLIIKSSSELESYVISMENDGYPYDTLPILVSGDNRGFAPGLTAHLNFVNNAIYLKDMEVVFGTSAMFFDHVSEKYGDQIPTKKGDWSGWWDVMKNSGPYSAAVMRWVQEITARLLDHGVLKEGSEEYYDIMYPLITFMEHANHGTAGWPGLLTQSQLDDSNVKVMEYSTETYDAVQTLLDRIFYKKGLWFFNKPVLFNPLDKSVSQLVKIPSDEWTSEQAPVVSIGGNEYQSWPYTVEGENVWQSDLQGYEFYGEIPPGFSRYKIKEWNPVVEKEINSNVMENDFYKIQFGDDSVISSIYDKTLEQEVAFDGFGLAYESYNPRLVLNEDLRPIEMKTLNRKIVKYAYKTSALINFASGPVRSLEVTLPENDKGINFRYVLDEKEYIYTPYRFHSRNYYIHFPVGFGYDFQYQGPRSMVQDEYEFTVQRPALFTVKDTSALVSDDKTLTFASRQAFTANYYDEEGFLLYHLLRDYGQAATSDAGIADMNDIEPGSPELMVFEFYFTSGDEIDHEGVEIFENPAIAR